MTKITNLRHHKLVPTALIVAALIALPTAANVYAQTPSETMTDDTDVVSKETNTTHTAKQLVVETEEPTVTETPTPSPSPAPTESPTDPALTAVTLAQAQAIAETEHPDSVVVTSKTKTIDGQTVYAFTFADGWKVYVRASDGTVIKVQDKANKEHACQNKHKTAGVHAEDKQHESDARATNIDWKSTHRTVHRNARR